MAIIFYINKNFDITTVKALNSIEKIDLPSADQKNADAPNHYKEEDREYLDKIIQKR